MKFIGTSLSLGASFFLAAVGCSSTPSDSVGSSGAGLEVMKDAAPNYAKLVYASYKDTLDGAKALKAAIDEFVADPSDDTLEAAKLAWKDSREPYLQTEAYRFYDGPIDDPTKGPEGQINAWPLDENYIDYTEDDPTSGIINDPTQIISRESLVSLNTQGGEANVSTGYHAIEFLLWGQDLSKDGPGARPFTDYTTAENADRRGEYLKVVSDLLVEDLEKVTNQWATGWDYRVDFEEAKPEEQLRRVLTGLIILSGFETGGERLQPALDSQNQEDEHSCFSDNTHRDFIQDVQGIQNVYLGKYAGSEKISGKGIKDVIAAVDSKLASDLEAQIDASLAAARAIKPPFDQEIAAGNDAGHERVQTLLDSLRAQEKLFEEAFQKFDLSIPEPS